MQILAVFGALSSQGVLKRGIYLTTSFTVLNFVNASAMRVIFFSKCLKFGLDSIIQAKNSEKVFFFLI